MNAPFAAVVAAAKRQNRNQWKLADAVLEECPEGDARTLRAMAKEAAEHGYATAQGKPYRPVDLKRAREVAIAWPPGQRDDASFEICCAAGSQDVLRHAIGWCARNGEPVTVKNVKMIRKVYDLVAKRTQ